MGYGSGLFRSRKVTDSGSGLVSRSGLVVLDRVMCGTGLIDGFTDAFVALPWRHHDPGVGFCQTVVGLADGAKTLTDVTAVAWNCGLFSSAASNSTMAEMFNRVASTELAGITRACAEARERAWAAGAGPNGSTLIVDIDATLISAIDSKQDTGANYKGGYGFHSLVAVCAETGEVFDAMLRPGNAGSNTAADHVELLDRVVDALPSQWGVGHNIDDTTTRLDKRIVVRCDTAGASGWFIEHCIARNLEFSFGYQIDCRVRDGLLLAQEEHWTPARDRNANPRPGSEILEITYLVDLGLPDEVRVIARRERPHPGAQLTLFDDLNGWRHQIFVTNSRGKPAGLERRHRQRGTAESVIRDLKACGATNLPFTDVVANQAWLLAAITATDVLAWVKAIGLNGKLAKATPKTLRYRLFHTAGRISKTGRVLHLDQTWPWTRHIITALKHISRAFKQPPTVTTQPT